MEKYSGIYFSQKHADVAPMSPEEIQAAGYLFGASNLALLPGHGDVAGALKKHGKDWKKNISMVKQILQSTAESDEMYDGFMEEINDWIKNMRKDPGTQKMWQEELKKAGLA